MSQETPQQSDDRNVLCSLSSRKPSQRAKSMTKLAEGAFMSCQNPILNHTCVASRTSASSNDPSCRPVRLVKTHCLLKTTEWQDMPALSLEARHKRNAGGGNNTYKSPMTGSLSSLYCLPSVYQKKSNRSRMLSASSKQQWKNKDASGDVPASSKTHLACNVSSVCRTSELRSQGTCVLSPSHS